MDHSKQRQVTDKLFRMEQLGLKEVRQIESSPIYFVASAPLAGDGTVNLSPKGLADTISIVDPFTLAYLDLTGSGAETAAHLKENGRITMMWCSFANKPNILRVYGRGYLHLPDSERFLELRGRFGSHLGVRGIVEVAIASVKNSCGFGVPVASKLIEREDLDQWLDRKGEPGLIEYQNNKNVTSLDGLPAYPAKSEPS